VTYGNALKLIAVNIARVDVADAALATAVPAKAVLLTALPTSSK
jgi:hypothetical protein